MKSLVQFLNENQSFLVNKHTKSFKKLQVYLWDNYTYNCLCESEEDIDVLIDKAVKLKGKTHMQIVETGRKKCKEAFYKGEQVLIGFGESIEAYNLSVGYLRLELPKSEFEKECKFIKEITLDDFNPEYFKKEGWLK